MLERPVTSCIHSGIYLRYILCFVSVLRTLNREIRLSGRFAGSSYIPTRFITNLRSPQSLLPTRKKTGSRDMILLNQNVDPISVLSVISSLYIFVAENAYN